ncbi:hypothetical protein [Chitinophaga filiformis]|uniref:Uncharacterized protein n=1 Tax=Chitinophaga filiformis TaxID=104663 RepID=A0A1G7Y8N1_CHIFI|nr:hypothetical protein [Chitinophaga filiformis]SDG92812.1 hypothetical protein SAMN04488121_107249 [Chitinophaga filiformis]
MFSITEDIPITFINGQQIPARARILPDSLMMLLSTQQSIEAMEKEMMDAIGSVEDWLHMSRTDSLAFDAGTGLLKAVSFYYPELNRTPDNLHLLASAGKTVAIPQLDKDAPPFELIPFDYRYYHEEKDLLLCFGEAFTEVEQLHEITISAEVSLFFSEGQYCAWGVYHPEVLLTNRIGATTVYATDDFLKICFQDAYALITDETVEQMRDHDADVLRKIAALYNRIVKHNVAVDSPADVLKNWLFSLADKFYKEKELEGLFTR